MTPSPVVPRPVLAALTLAAVASASAATAYAISGLPLVNSAAQAVMFVAITLIGVVSVLHYRSSEATRRSTEAIRRHAERQMTDVTDLLDISRTYLELAKKQGESNQRTIERIPAEARRAVETKAAEVIEKLSSDSHVGNGGRSGEHKVPADRHEHVHP